MQEKAVLETSKSETQPQVKEVAPPIADSRAFAEEVIQKIEAQIKDEETLQAKDELGTITNSVGLGEESQPIAERLNIQPEYNALNTEAKTLQTGTIEKINEIENEGKNNVDANVFSKQYHHPDYRSDIAKSIIEARKSGETGVGILNEFHEKTDAEKNNLESQEKERSVSEIMKEKDLVVVHGIPFIQGGGGSNYNNKTVDRDKLTFEDSYKAILGLEPTISTSIPSADRENNGLYYPAGIILGEGKILSARNEDSGSVSFGLHKRIPKYGEGEKHTAVRSSIDIEKTVKRASESGNGAAWNELVVEKPKIAGMFYDLSFGEESFDPNDKAYEWVGDSEARKQEAEGRKKEFLKRKEDQLQRMRKEAEKIGVPLYVFKNENGELKKYRVDTEPNPGYTNESLKDELGPKSKEILARNNNNYFSIEFQEFNKEANRKLRILKGEEYVMVPVTAKEIYESKKETSNKEKKKIIEELKEKGVFREQSEKEVEKKLKTLEKESEDSLSQPVPFRP